MVAPPLPFAPPTLHDAHEVRRAACEAQAMQSDLAFANVYLLRRKYGTEIACEAGWLFRHFGGHERLQGYAFPCGSGDPTPALRRVEADAAFRGRPLRFCLLTEEQVQLLEGVFPGRFRFQADRGDADYVYERAQLAELSGARFHRKRNHLARFMRDCPTWNMAALTQETAPDALAVAQGWLAAALADAPRPALLHEQEAIVHAVECLDALSLKGAVLYVDARPVAMTVGSMVSPSVLSVHYEKCLPAWRGAYPLINQALAASLDCAFINREEDLNQPGLRQAKLSYFPYLILSKFSALPC